MTTDDLEIGKLLEALLGCGGFSQQVPPVEGLSPEKAFATLDASLRRGYVSARIQRSGSDQLNSAFNLTITASGRVFLERHRRVVSHPAEGGDVSIPLDPSLPARIQRRTQFIRLIYEEAEASMIKVIDGPRVGDDLGWPRGETDDVLRYWEGEGLLRYIADEGAICLTHEGIVEIERAISNPGVATAHFAPHTVIIVENMTNSQIQAGTIGSTQSSSSRDGIDAAAIKEFLDAFRSALIEAPLSSENDNVEVTQLVVLAEEELRSDLPNKRHLGSLVNTLRGIALGMVGSGAWAGVATLAHQMPH